MIVVFDKNKKPQSVSSIFTRLAKTSGELVITAVYRGKEQIWNLIKSCFGSGTWVDSSSWIDTEIWKN